MYPVSNTVKALFAAEQAQVLRITGDGISITDANIVMDSFTIDRFSCNTQKLEIGTAISADMTLKLNNHDGTYNDVQFEGKELFVEIGIADWTQDDPVVNWIPCGYFTSDVQPRKLNTITLQAMDRMARFDKPCPMIAPWINENAVKIVTENDEEIYFLAFIDFPSTVEDMVKKAAELCSVPFTQDISALPNAQQVFDSLPVTQEEVTFRDVVRWCAGIMGANAWIDWNGELRFSWYNNATGYIMTTANRMTSDLYENQITITGVQYTDNDEDKTVYVAGSTEYALDVSDNALINANNASTILTNIYNVVHDFVYTPFNATVLNAPYLWPMDRVVFTDKNGEGHVTLLTNVNHGINGGTVLAAIGETSQINNMARASGFTSQQSQTLNRIQRVNTANMAAAVEHATQMITGGLGGYVVLTVNETTGQTEEILIMDSPDKETAVNVWRFNQGGLGHSSNGYDGPYSDVALTADGRINANLITVGLMSANRISGGVIDGTTVLAKLLNIIDDNNNVIASFDDTIILGDVNSLHSEIDYNSFEMYDANGDVFMSVGDLRDADGKATLTQNYTGNGLQITFFLRVSVDSASDVTVTVNGSETSNWVLQDRVAIRFNQAPENGASITITYITHKPLYHYDFGIRKTNDINEIGLRSVVEGYNNIAKGEVSHAEGSYTEARDYGSHAEGGNTKARGSYSHAEGYYTEARWFNSHAEGERTVASGENSHAEGYYAEASGNNSHAEGHDVKASGSNSHAEGWLTVASNYNSHAEGYNTEASGYASHAEGNGAKAIGNASHAEGVGTIANKESQHVVGRWNVADPAGSGSLTYLEIVGNGSENSRYNIRTLDYNGNEWISGTLTQASDNRLKTEDGEVPDLSEIKARAFHWNANKQRHDDKLHLGYFAQDVEAIAPYLVDEDAMGYKSLDYNAVFVAKIAALEKRITELEKRLERGN